MALTDKLSVSWSFKLLLVLSLYSFLSTPVSQAQTWVPCAKWDDSSGTNQFPREEENGWGLLRDRHDFHVIRGTHFEWKKGCIPILPGSSVTNVWCAAQPFVYMARRCQSPTDRGTIECDVKDSAWRNVRKETIAGQTHVCGEFIGWNFNQSRNGVIVTRFDTPQIHTHQRTVAVHDSVALTTAQAQTILANVSTVLNVADSENDIDCGVKVQPKGTVGNFNVGTGIVNSQAALDKILGLPQNISIVSQVNFCEGHFNVNIVGCGFTPGRSFIVERRVRNEDILWAHLFGHNQGLLHRDASQNVMNTFLVKTGREVNVHECNSFWDAPLPFSIDFKGTRIDQKRSSSKGTRSRIGIKDFVHQIFIHGLPYQEAQRFGTKDIPVLLAMLKDPKEQESWPNIIGVLGIIGDKSVAKTLIAFLESGKAEVISPTVYKAKTSVLMALGYLANRTKSEVATGYLIDGLTTEAWKERNIAWKSPFTETVDTLHIQLVEMSIIGVALSGKAIPEAVFVLAFRNDPILQREPALYYSQEEEIQNLLKEAKRAHQKVSQFGLTAYYKEM